MARKANVRGRPREEDALRKSTTVKFRDDDYARVEAAASADRRTVTEFIRLAAIDAADSQLKGRKT